MKKILKTLKNVGWIILGASILMLFIIWIYNSLSSPSSDSPSQTQGSSQNNSSGQSGGETTKTTHTYPEKGKAYATPQKPVKAYINNKTMRLNFWGDGIVIKQNGTTFCSWKSGTDPECWMTLPDGDCDIYSLNGKTLVEWGIP